MTDGILNRKSTIHKLLLTMLMVWGFTILHRGEAHAVQAEITEQAGGGEAVGSTPDNGAEGIAVVGRGADNGAGPSGKTVVHVATQADIDAARQQYLNSVLNSFKGMGMRGGVEDMTTRGLLTEDNRERLEDLTARFGKLGYRLRIGFLDSDPLFSIGDFTNRIWNDLDCGPNDVIILGTKTGLHARSTLLNYGETRKLARTANPLFIEDRAEGIYFLSAPLMESAWRMGRKRVALGIVAMGSSLGLLAVVARALARRRKRAE